MRSTNISFWFSCDNVTGINFRFRLLVTWSSLHGRDASSHEIWCRYLYPMRSYWYFFKIKDGGRRHLGFGWAMGPPTKPHLWSIHPLNFFCHDRLGSFQVIRIWIFSRSSLKVLFTPPHRSDPLKRHFFALARNDAFLSPHWIGLHIADAQCDLWPWQRNQKKKDSGRLAIHPDHPRRRIDVKVCMPGSLRCVVLFIKFY